MRSIADKPYKMDFPGSGLVGLWHQTRVKDLGPWR